MKELAAKDEIDWLGPRVLSISNGPREQRHYDKYMQERKGFWRDLSNMRRHLEALYPNSALQSSLEDGAESASTAITGLKRRAGSVQNVAAKRTKPLVDAVPPPPVQNDRGCGHDNGTYTPNRLPPAFTNDCKGDAAAEAPYPKRRHDK